MTQHPSDEVLIQLADPGSESLRESDRAHLDRCDRCTTRVAEFRAVIWALRSPSLAEVPEPWFQTALERMRDLESAHATESVTDRLKAGVAGLVSRAREVVEEISAGLALDSHAGALLPGIRGKIASAPRQLLYESAAGQIHIMVETLARGRFKLDGQFLPLDGIIAPGARIVAETSGTALTAELEPTGEFQLHGLPEGDLQLTIENAGVRIRLTSIHLPPGEDS